MTGMNNAQLNTTAMTSPDAGAILPDLSPDKAVELLKHLSTQGIIDLGSAEEDMKKKKLQEILDQHPYAIYQGSDGKWYTHIPDESRKEKRRKVVKTTLEKVHEELYKHYIGEKEHERLMKTTIEDLFPKWLDFKALHTDASTYITRLKSDWKRYYEGTPIVKIPITKLTRLQLDEWIHRLIKERNVSQKQYSNFVTIMNQVLEYAVDLEIIESNPFARVRVDGRHLFRPEKKKSSESEVYSLEEEAALKELAWADFENRTKTYVLSPLAVLFQFETGVRIGELCVLRYEDVHGDYLRVQRMYRRDNKETVPYTKGSYGDRDVILTSEAKRIIKICRRFQKENGAPKDGYIFSIDDNPCSYYAISDLYRKYCSKLGIEMKSSHKVRKTVITALLDGDVNVNSVREMAGHRDEKTTYASYYYDRTSAEDKVKKVEAALHRG